MTPTEAQRIIDSMRKVYHHIKWSILYSSLLEDDPEALAFVTEKLDSKTVAKLRREQRAEERREAEREAYEAQGLDLEEVAHLGPNSIDELASGQMVWLYHGTSTKLVPSIKREGLVYGKRWVSSEQPGVYLTVIHGGPGDGGTAWWYAEYAAGQFGGSPTIVRVLVPYDELEWDTDDEDIKTGNYQWVIDCVPPEYIKEIGGRRFVYRGQP